MQLLLFLAVVRHIPEHEYGREEHVEGREHDEHGEGEDDVRHPDLALLNRRYVDEATIPVLVLASLPHVVVLAEAGVQDLAVDHRMVEAASSVQAEVRLVLLATGQ